MSETTTARDRDTILALLRAHRAELEARGVRGLSLFGSFARGQGGPRSDVDLAIEIDRERVRTLVDLAALGLRLEEILDRPVDTVLEPVRRPALQARIDQDRARAY